MTSVSSSAAVIAGGIAVRRNRYFTGKFMTETDFATDPEYFLSRHRVHNRLLHGRGVAGGLDVVPHPHPSCQPGWVVVQPGLAIDGAGRELVVEHETPVEIVPQGLSEDGPLVLCARYGEEPIDEVPALYAEGIADPELRIANRVREVVCWQIVPFAETAPGEWPRGETPGSDASPERVALALIRRGANREDPLTIELDGRPELVASTRVASLNWPHGGTVTACELRQEMAGALRVAFSRPLQPARGDATGIGPFTFQVSWGAPQGMPQSVPGVVELAAGGRLAVFRPRPDWLAATVDAGSFFVTLKCDFILDLHGQPVAGGHPRGRLPSGGAAGGLFESWFSVASTHPTANASSGGGDE